MKPTDNKTETKSRTIGSGEVLLTQLELAKTLGVSPCLIDRITAEGCTGCIGIDQVVRYRLDCVLRDLERNQTIAAKEVEE